MFGAMQHALLRVGSRGDTGCHRYDAGCGLFEPAVIDVSWRDNAEMVAVARLVIAQAGCDSLRW